MNNQYLKPNFDIQRVNVEGSRLYYELFYKTDNQFSKLVDACFFTLKDAEKYQDELLEEC